MRTMKEIDKGVFLPIGLGFLCLCIGSWWELLFIMFFGMVNLLLASFYLAEIILNKKSDAKCTKEVIK